MKKIFLSLLVLIPVFAVLSCKFKLKEEELLPKPTVRYNKEVTISILKKSSTTKYINIYRKDKTEDSETPIGIVYPKSDESYIFSDDLVFSNHEYSYRVRYSDEDGYTYTEWSDPVKITDGYSEYDKLKYSDKTLSFKLDETNYSLKIIGEVYLPEIEDFEKDYKPMLIISCPAKTQLFELSSLEENTIIPLRGNLPSDFIARDITIKGILAQKVTYTKSENDSKKDIESILWTEPSEVTVLNSKGNTIFIPELSGSDGIDYSRSAAFYD